MRDKMKTNIVLHDATDAIVEHVCDEVKEHMKKIWFTEYDISEINDITSRALKVINNLESARSINRMRKILIGYFGQAKAFRIIPEESSK